jgi:exonuclease SbcD
MKTIICGDTHIGAVFGLGRANGSGGNTRVDDYERSLNFIIDYAIQNEVDVFIQTGDLFEVRNPTTEHIQIADRAIKRLSDANIFTAIIMGNHDYRKTGDSYTSALATMQANSYKNVRILLKPESIIYSNKSGDSQAMLLIPYRDKRMYPGSGAKESTDLFNEHIKELSSRIPSQIPSIAVGHNFFFEGNYFDFGGHEVLAFPDSFSNLDAVVMGHYHEFKRIRASNPAAYYVGSLEKTNFGDSDIDKFFLVFDSEKKEFEKIKTPTRELIDLSLDLSSSTAFNYLQDYSEQLKKYTLSDKICRAKIKIKDGTQALFSRSEIEKTLYSVGAFHVSKIIWDVEQVKLEKDKEILSHKTDFEIFQAFAKTQGLGEDFLQKLLDEAKKIMV